MNNFFPCLLIPIYNHWPTIGRTVERLSVHGLPIYIVDDGSDEATQAELARIAAVNPLVVLFRLAQNEGKGGAVMRGLCEARAAGCTHALQIDADGQHDTDDVSRFLAWAGKIRWRWFAANPFTTPRYPKAVCTDVTSPISGWVLKP